MEKLRLLIVDDSEVLLSGLKASLGLAGFDVKVTTQTVGLGRQLADRDVIIIPGARAKPLDPSLPVMPPGIVPTGAKVGIDATIGEGIPRERFERISYAYADSAKIDDYLAGKADARVVAQAGAVPALAAKIHAAIGAQPLYYSELADRFAGHDFQTVARALGQLHAEKRLWQTAEGRLCTPESPLAAKLGGKA